MKILIKTLLIMALLMFTSTLHANSTLTAVATPDPQTGAPTVSLSWTLSAIGAPPVISQNMYRAACTGTVTSGVCSTDSTETFAKLPAGINAVTATFTDTTVVAGSSYIYYVTAVCPATGTCVGESIPSNHVAVTVPPNSVPPPPPTGLGITSVTKNIVNGVETVTASWSDTPQEKEYFFFSDGASFQQEGVIVVAASGNATERVTLPAGGTVYFMVCNVHGACVSQSV